MNPDFLDMLRALLEAEVRFLIVGAYALNVHTKPRATGDLDIWIEPVPENGPRVMRALKAFGAPLHEISEADFAKPGLTFQIGIPPVRIDLLTQVTALEFSEAWQDRVEHQMGPYVVGFLGKKSLIKNKRAIGRHKDLADLESLERDGS
jgi:hypothetical protein